jgi:hypothetical protein
MFIPSYNTTTKRKTCNTCKESLPESIYYFYRDPKGGLRDYCKNCPQHEYRGRKRNKLEDVWKRYEVNKNGCWVYTGPKDKWGYGTFYYQQASYKAHRISWYLMHGEIEDKKVLDHLCKNKSCINPGHLEPVSQMENVLRHERQKHCKGCNCEVK